MRYGILKLIFSASMFSLLAGCAAPKYVLPEGSPSAKIKSKIRLPDDRRDSIEIIKLGGCFIPRQSRLFYIKGSAVVPLESVEIEADRDITFVYLGSPRKHPSCFIRFHAKLEAGKEYSLVGGSVWRPMPFRISGECKLAKLACSMKLMEFQFQFHTAALPMKIE